MITIAFTNRDRDLKIVQKCFNSLSCQSVNSFQVFLVDYGSEIEYLNKLKILIKEFPFVKLIECDVRGQLWSKSRAINIAIKLTTNPYFLVADIDLIFHPNFIQKAQELVCSDKFIYFQTGFLSKKESSYDKSYKLYEVSFMSNEEATGITLFPLQSLKAINGYDEFYHGWGAEDTDAHIRMKNIGICSNFYNSNILVKHQWHPKAYRTKKSSNPFHTKLEQINHAYMQFSSSSKLTKVNLKNEWGKLPVVADYQKLERTPDFIFEIVPVDTSISALLFQLKNYENHLIKIIVKDVSFSEKLKQRTKRLLGKKYKNYLKLVDVNNTLLEEVVSNYRNLPYQFFFEIEKKEIQLIIQF